VERESETLKVGQRRNANLVLFEHVLQLSSLEFMEKRNHWELNDEKLLFALGYYFIILLFYYFIILLLLLY
jgi:hypothetical protein